VFYFGGLLPIALTVILVLYLPESIRFMVTHGADSERIGATLRRIAPNLAYSAEDRFVIGEAEVKGFPVRRLFTDGRAFGTLLLWVPFFMNLLLLFFMYNWLPPVLAQAGLPITRAVIGTVLFNLGGVIGGLIQGHLIDRIGHYIVLTVAYALGAVFVGITGYLSFSFPLIMSAVFLAGFCTIGAQFGANSLAANFYPTHIRATGVGWALGVGRIGSILGPVIGGVLIGLNFDLHQIFLSAAIPAICATVAIALLSRVAPLSRKP
jgi:AAHS family 4-hydroxybenzoate transporter-like MFS transporter